jgi:Fe2+ transport system protein FeoA
MWRAVGECAAVGKEEQETLLEARKGSRVRILEIPDDRARAQCIRFGIGEGTVVDWAEPLRVGPVLVRQANQEICLGRKLAARIVVEEAGAAVEPAASDAEHRLDARGRGA